MGPELQTQLNPRVWGMLRAMMLMVRKGVYNINEGTMILMVMKGVYNISVRT